MAGLRILFAILLLPLYAHAEDSCYRDFLVIDRVIAWDFSRDQAADFTLPSWNGSTPPFYTDAAAHISLRGNKLNTSFDFKTDLVSLPYNVYRMDILVGKEADPENFVSSRDFTANCKNAGFSFFPGDKVKLLPEKIPALSSGGPRGVQPVRIRIWGILR
jgi:hypothetical protein